jgi:spore photoproduct lyase
VEFKTKSVNIDHLLPIGQKGNAVLSWSLNTERVIERYEKDTAGLADRIGAAARAADSGFLTAFHFDPIIDYEGCEFEYLGVIDSLLSRIRVSSVAWISMGCFRFSPSFKDHVRARFPDEQLTCAEMFPSFDGKFRYLKQKRVALYRTLYDRIIQHSRRIPVYLCMEPRDVWDSLFHETAPSGRGYIARLHGMIEETVLAADR